MNARLIILIVLASGLAIFFATRASAPPSDAPVRQTTGSPEDMKRIKELETPLHERPLPGSEPEVPPVFDVRVEVDQTSTMNRLLFYVSEEHGYYVETFTIAIRHFDSPDLQWEDGTYVTSTYILDMLKANETLELCADITNNELESFGGALEDSSHWRAQVTKHGRAREKNPEKFPIIDEFVKCR